MSKLEERRFIDALDVGVLIHTGGRVVQVNAWLSHVLDCEPSYVVGANDAILQGAGRLSPLVAVLSAQPGTRGQVRFNTPEGAESILGYTAAATRWDGVAAVAITLHNETLPDAHQVELAKARQRADRLMEHASDAIVAVDADSRIIVFNRQAVRLFGWTAEEAIGQTLAMLLPDESVTRHYGMVGNFRDSGRSNRGMGRDREVWGRRRDGELFPCEISISKSDDLLLAVVRDRTGALRSQQLHRAVEEATSALVGEGFVTRLLSAFRSAYGVARTFVVLIEGDERRLWRSWGAPVRLRPAMGRSLLAEAEAAGAAQAEGAVKADFPGDMWLFEGLKVQGVMLAALGDDGVRVVAGAIDDGALVMADELGAALRFMAWRASGELRALVAEARLEVEARRRLAQLNCAMAPTFWWRRMPSGVFGLVEANQAAGAVSEGGLTPARGASVEAVLGGLEVLPLLMKAHALGLAEGEGCGPGRLSTMRCRALRVDETDVLLTVNLEQVGGTLAAQVRPLMALLDSPVPTMLWRRGVDGPVLTSTNAAGTRWLRPVTMSPLGGGVEALLGPGLRAAGQAVEAVMGEGCEAAQGWNTRSAGRSDRVYYVAHRFGDDVVLQLFHTTTERAQARGERLVAEETCSSLLSGEAFQTDRFGAWLKVSACWCQRVGMSAEAALGDGWRAALHPDQRTEVLRAWAQAISGAAQFRAEVQLGDVWVLMEAMPRWGADRRLIGWTGQVVDITASHRAQEALLRVQDSLNKAQRIASIGNWDWDIRTGTLWWSDEVYRIFGIAGRLFGASYEAFLEQVHVEDRARVERAVAEALGGVDYMVEHRLVRRSGEVRRVRQVGEVTRDAKGCAIRMVGTVQDITDRHALEVKVHQTHKMEAVGRLAAGIAHDFNNLLSVMIGVSECAIEDAEPGTSLREDLEEIMAAGQRAARLTRQLLAFSKQQHLSPVTISLSPMINDLAGMLRRLVGADIELEVLCEAEALRVFVDVGQLEQVVVNLVVNARDAMPDGGRLTLRTELSAVAVAKAAQQGVKPGRYCCLVVEDTGEGIAEAQILRIFEPFFTTKGADKGTGLGLATVHGIVRQSGGYIEVESALGVGTTFTVGLPETGMRAQSDTIPVGQIGAELDWCVLLVEDDGAVRRVLQRTLEAAGFTVLAAAGGEEALALVRDTHEAIDAALLDVVMPGISGGPLAAHLSAACPGIEIVFTSGYPEQQLSMNGIVPGEVVFLRKPIERDALVKAMLKACARHRA